MLPGRRKLDPEEEAAGGVPGQGPDGKLSRRDPQEFRDSL